MSRSGAWQRVMVLAAALAVCSAPAFSCLAEQAAAIFLAADGPDDPRTRQAGDLVHKLRGTPAATSHDESASASADHKSPDSATVR